MTSLVRTSTSSWLEALRTRARVPGFESDVVLLPIKKASVKDMSAVTLRNPSHSSDDALKQRNPPWF